MAARPSPRTLLKIPDFEKKVNERLEDLLAAMIDLAMGHFVTVSKYNKFTGDVETRIYEQPPDFKALAFLIENVIGKVPSRIELTGEGGGPVKVIPYMTMPEALRIGIVETAMQEQKRLESSGDTDVIDDTVDAEFFTVEDEGGDADGA